jgi:hypothetical protein
MVGKLTWLIGDGFIPEKSNGDQISHESICVLNLSEQDAQIHLSFYFEDRDPMDRFESHCKVDRTHHIRLDKLTDRDGRQVPRGVPYAVKVVSSVPVIVQHTRLDTSQEALSLMTTMAYPIDGL